MSIQMDFAPVKLDLLLMLTLLVANLQLHAGQTMSTSMEYVSVPMVLVSSVTIVWSALLQVTSTTMDFAPAMLAILLILALLHARQVLPVELTTL